MGLQTLSIENQLLGSIKPYAEHADDVREPYHGNVLAMFDRGLYDMVAADPQKGIWEPGTYNAGLATGTIIGESKGEDVTSTMNDPGLLLAGIPPETGDHYIFTPLNSWKYYPQSVRMKFSHRLARTFYNPTNVVQTVFVTELRRKRKQLQCANSQDMPINFLYDYDVLDVQPYLENRRLQYAQHSGNGWVVYSPDLVNTNQLTNVIRAGEYYRRFLYVRFGQYESIQYQSRGFTNVAARRAGTTGPGFANLGQWDPRFSYNPVTNEPTDPAHPSSYSGYSQEQYIRDPVTVSTIGGLGPVGSSVDPWESKTGGGFNQTPQAYELSMDFDPLKNPFLKRLFYMRRTRYVLPPGGSARHVFRCSGTATPFGSNILNDLHFYSQSGTYDWSTDTDREVPYGLPFSNEIKPPPAAHLTRRQGGFSDVSVLTQVKGQMVFLKAVDGTGEVMQYAQTRVVSHDHHIVRFKVCSYGKPVIGGARTHSSFLASDNTTTDYQTMNPTAAPAAVAPADSST